MPYRDPELRRASVREAKRRHRAALGKPPGKPRTGPELADLRYERAADVLALLADQTDAVLADGSLGTLERARCIGYLAGIMLRAIETGTLEDRIAELESGMIGKPISIRWPHEPPDGDGDPGHE